MRALIGDQEFLYNMHVQLTLLHLDLQLLPHTFCKAFVLRIAKRENMAIFSGGVLQFSFLMVVTEAAIPGPVTEKDGSAETSAQSIS